MSDRIGQEMDRIVNMMIEDYGRGRDVDRMDIFNIPDRDKILDIVSKMLRIVFPGYYREHAYRSYNPSRQLSVVIEDVMYNLNKQLQIALRYDHAFDEKSDAEVEEAARMVGADAFIRQMQDGYLSNVGEGGNRLSTGQKQMISFARAILTNPALFVLDEATSSVDTETEQQIQRAIQKVLNNRTSFIIAHRLSTIRTADRILVIQHGQIAESGTHRELMKKQGIYHQLYTNQFQDEQTAAALAV